MKTVNKARLQIKRDLHSPCLYDPVEKCFYFNCFCLLIGIYCLIYPIQAIARIKDMDNLKMAIRSFDLRPFTIRNTLLRTRSLRQLLWLPRNLSTVLSAKLRSGPGNKLFNAMAVTVGIIVCVTLAFPKKSTFTLSTKYKMWDVKCSR